MFEFQLRYDFLISVAACFCFPCYLSLMCFYQKNVDDVTVSPFIDGNFPGCPRRPPWNWVLSPLSNMSLTEAPWPLKNNTRVLES